VPPWGKSVSPQNRTENDRLAVTSAGQENYAVTVSRHVQTAKPEACNAPCILQAPWNFRALELLHRHSRRTDLMQSLQLVCYVWKRLYSNTVILSSLIVLHRRIDHGRIQHLQRLYRLVRVYPLRLRRISLKKRLSMKTGL
jgi:hypothetical protein